MWEAVETLAPLGPRFVSVTYGAGGSTRERTHATVARIARETNIPAAAHLTCVEATKAEIDAGRGGLLERGRAPYRRAARRSADAGAKYATHPGGYENAADLVAGLKRLHPFEISVAAYPECHPDSPHSAHDLDNLKRKFDAGANRAITQFFHEPDTFFRFRDDVAAAGIDAEIVPGIMPVVNFASVKRMSAMCNTAVPAWLERLFDGLEDKPAARQLVAATVAAELCRKLYAGGVRSFHFYTLNRAELAYAICHLLGVRADETEGGGGMSAREKLKAQAAERILVIDGAFGTEIQNWKLSEGCYAGNLGLSQGPEGQQRHPRADQARGAGGDPPRLFRGRGGHRRDQHVQREPDQPGGLCRRASGARDQPRRRRSWRGGWRTSSRPRTAARGSSRGRSGRPTRRCR